MASLVRKLMPWRRGTDPAIPDGLRICAIGDIHGCLDIFGDLLERVDADLAARARLDNRVVILGDFIDRGSDSAGVVNLLRAFDDDPNVIVLMGNHEAMAVEALGGAPEAMDRWLAMGGGAALESWGVPPALLYHGSEQEVAEAARAFVPADVVEWLAGLPHYSAVGDYLFVHAGIRPGLPIEEQDSRDLLWIREDFLESRADHGAMIVHGHSATEAVQERRNRIGIDTGAYWTGCLTALCLEGRDRWLIST